jgi:hypothetical protein
MSLSDDDDDDDDDAPTKMFSYSTSFLLKVCDDGTLM